MQLLTRKGNLANVKQRIDVLCHILEQVWGQVEKYNSHKTALCHNPHNLSTEELQTHLLSMSYVHTHTHKTCSSLYFCKNIKCLNFCLLRICQVFTLSCETLYQWVMASYCCMRKSRMDTAGWVKRWKILRDCMYKFLTYRQYMCAMNFPNENDFNLTFIYQLLQLSCSWYKF